MTRRLPVLAAASACVVLAAGAAGFWLGDRRTAEVGPPPTGWFGAQLEVGQRQVIEQLTATFAHEQLRARGAGLLDGGQDALSGVPFRTLRVRLAETGPTSAQIATGRFSTRAVVEYRLAVDDVLVGRTAQARFRLTPHGPELVALTGSGQDLWDHEPVDAVRSGHVLVLGRRGDPRLPGLAELVGQARTAVSAFWSAPWPQDVVAVLPSSPRLLDPLVESPDGSDQVAVTLWRSARDGTVIRVMFNPDVYDAMPTEAREIVARHEITHVAQDALPRGGVPVWLVEGLAEYVGYRGTGMPDSWIGRELFEQVRADGVPQTWPPDAAFALGRGDSDRAVAYQQGWAFCRMVADRYGEDRLVPFYAAAARATGSPADRIDRAAERVLDTDAQTLLGQWQQWLRAAA